MRALTHVNPALGCPTATSMIVVSLKALSDAEAERSFVHEKLTSVERELSAAVAEHGREKREMLARQEQQSQRIDALQSELKNFQQHLEHTKYTPGYLPITLAVGPTGRTIGSMCVSVCPELSGL